MKCLATILAIIVVRGVTSAAVFTNSASADAFVRAAAAASNYGGAGALSVSGTNAANGSGTANGAFDSFIRFNTAAMVASFNSLFGSNNWGISGARLRVTELAAPANALFNRGTGSFGIRWIANDRWAEGAGTPNAPTTGGITYNDEPGLLDAGTDASLGAFTNRGVDATQSFALALPPVFVNDLGAGGEVGLYLTALDSGVGFTFDSRSFGTVSARPFLEVSAVARPGVTSMRMAGADVLLTGTNGEAGGTYSVYSSPNLNWPLSQWLPVATNVFSASGDFAIRLTNVWEAHAPCGRHFILQTP